MPWETFRVYPMVRKGLENHVILAYPFVAVHEIPAEGAERNTAPSRTIKEDFRPAIWPGGQMRKPV